MDKPRILSGIQPTGDMHLGNYLGALRLWVDAQYDALPYYCVVDLHSLTVQIDDKHLSQRTLDAVAMLLAIGLDPQHCTIFVQSHVPEHTSLSWILECIATMGELGRMTQFKDKGSSQESVSAGLFTYPVLMAADILLYDAAKVPIGDDQRQHLELARRIATRFNSRFGKTFVIPEALVPPVAARVMDLQNPSNKMSKSSESSLGTVFLLDSPDAVESKVRKAVTDSDGTVHYDPETKPGISNLLEILSAITSERPDQLALKYSSYGALKTDVAGAITGILRPIAERYKEISSDKPYVQEVIRNGAMRAREVASVTLARANKAIGLLEPPAAASE
ncbi:MAG: tryptophan--tRNA ligase [Actinobacteria bacterium]|jgi:tryptophanyl-tRNA synthetase|nr:tryptophan--tRNA ligase [Actinomycetota bacterium]